jgi:hypothetical protein
VRTTLQEAEMSENNQFGFAKLVPGFDFLQNIAKGASQSIPQLPNLSNWIAPTLNVEELEKRINELRAVHFWLDQNSKALGATIQALEVQKMTLATLQGMNFSMGEVAEALKLKTPEPASRSPTASDAAEAEAAKRKADAKAKAAAKPANPESSGSGGGVAPVDPLQWWGALTQQFQEIAAHTMRDVAQKTAAEGAKASPGGAKVASKAAKKTPARKAPASKRSTST